MGNPDQSEDSLILEQLLEAIDKFLDCVEKNPELTEEYAKQIEYYSKLLKDRKIDAS